MEDKAVETTRLRHLLEQNGLTIMDVLQDILAELKYIRQELGGEKTTQEEAQAMFWQDAHHFDGSGYPTSVNNAFLGRYPEYKKQTPYTTTNPTEVDRND
jgi:hypothetical protein